MARTDPMQDDTATDTDAMSGADIGSDDMSNGFCIEIRCTPDGKFAVGVEPLAEEAKEEAGEGGEGEDGDYQPVASIGEVLKLVREIVAHAGELVDTGAAADEMNAGYKAGA